MQLNAILCNLMRFKANMCDLRRLWYLEEAFVSPLQTGWLVSVEITLYYWLTVLKSDYLLAVLDSLSSGSTVSLPSLPSFSSFSSGFKLSVLLAVFVNVRVIFAKKPSNLKNQYSCVFHLSSFRKFWKLKTNCIIVKRTQHLIMFVTSNIYSNVCGLG